jgi:hypothetical protein
MVKVELTGIAKVTAKGRPYYYAWRGGPRLRGKPGSPEFMASYNEALENRRIPDPDRFRSLVTLYKASTDYKGAGSVDGAQLGAVAGPHCRPFRRPSHCSIRPAREDQAVDSPLAQPVGR